jgi:hypothetical protein
VTNAERMVLLRRARYEIERVRDELGLMSSTCPKCGHSYFLDEAASKLEQELAGMTAALTSWVIALSRRSPTSEQVSAET